MNQLGRSSNRVLSNDGRFSGITQVKQHHIETMIARFALMPFTRATALSCQRKASHRCLLRAAAMTTLSGDRRYASNVI